MHPNSGMPVVAGRKIFVFHDYIKIGEHSKENYYFFNPYAVKDDGSESKEPNSVGIIHSPLVTWIDLSLARIFLINGIQWQPDGIILVKWRKLQPAKYFQINPLTPFVVVNKVEPHTWAEEFMIQCETAASRYEAWRTNNVR